MTDTTQEESNNLWSRLRRRKLVQWSIAYAAGAWGLLQGIGFAADAFHWPDAIKQIALLLLLIGLPIVLVLAWYHGDRGEHRVGRTELAILTLLFLLGGGLLWRYQHAARTTIVATTPESIAHPAVIADDNSIAVLPFINMSSDQEQEYFSDGLSEELLNLLAQVPQLRVIARTSSFSFKGKEADIAEIASRLNVAHVLEGSVRKSGDTLRVTAQLIRASDSSHLWSQTYDRRMTDVFKVQDEIAAAVVGQLKIKLLGTAPKAKTTDPKAYALFLRAREIGHQSTEAANEQSIALYQQALALDPAYTASWVGLAGAYCKQVDYGWRRADEGIRLAREATAKALALDPDYAPAHAQLGWIAIYYDRDLAAAAEHLEHALTLEPANPEIIGTAGVLARRLGRMDHAIAIAEHLVARDPVNADGHFDLGLGYSYAGRLDEAIAEFRTALRLSPGYSYAHAIIGEVLLQKGDAKAALAETLQEADEQLRFGVLPMIYHALGDKPKSDAVLAELIRQYEKTAACDIATVLAYRGEAERAFEWLDQAIQQHDPTLGAIAVNALFANIHSDPRWLPFLRKNGMAPEQLAAIQFDVKLPK